MIYFCCDLLRREATRQSPLNGIDFIEVIDAAAAVEADRQRFIHVHLLRDPAPETYDAQQVVVAGPSGALDVVDVQTGLGPQANILVVELTAPGNFDPHTLRIRRSTIDERPPVEFDPAFASVEFSFKSECPSDFDCLDPCDCDGPPRQLPEIDYMARDIGSFRRVMLDRLATIHPNAPPPHAADFRMALVDGLAVLADQVAQAQDAAHTDAYLSHVRSRIAARRLALLVDYRLDEGQNARCFMHLAAGADLLPVGPNFDPVIPVGTAFASRISDQSTVLTDPAALDGAQVVFEAMLPLEAVFAAHTELAFYTWSDQRCCLPAGAVTATLDGHFPDLAPGQFLAFEEITGPRTGNPADRDRSNRPVVRLTAVTAFAEGAPLTDPVTGALITQIAWDTADALEHPLCLSSETAAEFGRLFLPRVSVARGNIVLTDHGRTIAEEDLGPVPQSTRSWAPGLGPVARAEAGVRPTPCTDLICDPPEPERMPPPFAPILAQTPLSFAAPLNADAGARAQLAARGTPLPAISLTGTLNTDVRGYSPQGDLLGSEPDTADFVPEIDNNGHAHLRFGDNVNGLRPNSDTSFTATYRIGQEPLGNIGEDRLVHILGPQGIATVRNMTPGVGGRAPESIRAMRRRAPFAYRTQDRAVTRQDHDVAAARFIPPEGPMQGTVTDIMHTGSWHTVLVSADRRGGLPVDDAFETDLRAHLESFRMAGRDLEVSGPIPVPLETDLEICVSRQSLRGEVKAALLKRFSNRILPDGTLGAFHPDRLTFGQPVYLSPLIALAQSVTGVRGVTATLFRRFHDPDSSGLDARVLTFGRREIPRLDNDPSRPGNGVLRLTMVGGR